MNTTRAAALAARCSSEGYKDLLTAFSLLGFALGGFFFINPNGSAVYPGDGGITWQTLPFGYAGILAILSCVYVVQSIRKIRAEQAPRAVNQTSEADSNENRVVMVRRVVSIALLLVFASLLDVIGFAIAAPMFLFALFRLFQRGAWTGDLALSVGGGLLLWLLFVPVLKMNLKGDVFDPLTPFLMNLTKMVGL